VLEGAVMSHPFRLCGARAELGEAT